MLPRQLEPEVMDDASEANIYDEMDHGTVNRAFVDDWISFQTPFGEVLDLGSGTALIPIEACRRGLELRITAVDMSPAMLQIGKVRIEVAGLTSQIRLDLVDAKQLPYDDGQFQWVISNSLIHHLDAPESVLGEAVRVTARGGGLFFRDLIRPESKDHLEQLVDRYAGHDSPIARELLANSLHAALRLDEIREIVSRLGYPPESVQPTSDRHWTWSVYRE